MHDAPLDRIIPVILAGGSGERLWPLSKVDYPKQFVTLPSHRQQNPYSLFQQTLLRVRDRRHFTAPLILCNEEHRFIVTEQLQHIGIVDAGILIEPVARNTAPALTLAALHIQQHAQPSGAGGVMLVLPSDHLIERTDIFLAAALRGKSAADAGWLLTFGITPDRPETGYGYILQGEPLDGTDDIRHIARFVEKPDRETAERYLKEGGYAWNSGMFMLHSRRLLEALDTHAPAIVTACRKAYAAHESDPPFLRMDKNAMQDCPSASIDYALMEHTDKGAVIPVELGWSDLGSWPALYGLSDVDTQGNAVHSDAVLMDCANCYVHTPGILVAGIGLDDMVVVSADNALLVGPKERMRNIKALVHTMHDRQLPDTMLTTFAHRPWGSFHHIDRGEHYQVKRLYVKPGGKISLQTHEKRSEHWVVVSGRATVTNGDTTFALEANQSVYIPAGTRHRLENRETEPLIVIEVQTGSYLGEDDITRFEDIYNRKDQA